MNCKNICETSNAYVLQINDRDNFCVSLIIFVKNLKLREDPSEIKSIYLEKNVDHTFLDCGIFSSI